MKIYGYRLQAGCRGDKCVVIVLLLILTLISSCSMHDSGPHTGGSLTMRGGSSNQELRVGVGLHSPPFVFQKNGQLQGLEVDFAKDIADGLGRRVRFMRMGWDKLLPALEKGNIDIIMSGMTITEQRSYRVAFAKPYMRSGQMLLVKSTDVRRFGEGIYSLMGTKPRIGTVKSTTGDFFITKNIHGATIERFSTSEKAVNALIAGKVDVVVHDAPIVSYLAATNETQKLVVIPQSATEEYLAWAVAKSNTELLQELNNFIDRSAEAGTLQQTIGRWLRLNNS